jgi:hypothetical protein
MQIRFKRFMLRCNTKTRHHRKPLQPLELKRNGPTLWKIILALTCDRGIQPAGRAVDRTVRPDRSAKRCDPREPLADAPETPATAAGHAMIPVPIAHVPSRAPCRPRRGSAGAAPVAAAAARPTRHSSSSRGIIPPDQPVAVFSCSCWGHGSPEPLRFMSGSGDPRFQQDSKQCLPRKRDRGGGARSRAVHRPAS